MTGITALVVLGVVAVSVISIILVPLKYFPKYRNIVWKYAGVIWVIGVIGGAIFRVFAP